MTASPPESSARAHSWAWLPLPLFLAAMIGGQLADISGSHESPHLLIVLVLIFPIAFSFLTARALGQRFLREGAPGILLLGCGVVVWGAMSLIGVIAMLIDEKLGGGAIVTLHNICVWIAAFFHLAGAGFASRWSLILRATKLWLAGAYTFAILLVGSVAGICILGWMPPFFVQGEGGTLVRQFMLGSAISMLLLTAVLCWSRVGQSEPRFARWYGVGLTLLAMGLAAIMVSPVRGSLLGWVGRFAQFLGIVYLWAAANSSPARVETAVPPGVGNLRSWNRYAFAVVIAVAAAAVRMSFLESLGPHAPYLTFFPAVLLAAIYGGLPAGILASIASSLLVVHFWVEPANSLTIMRSADWLALATFLFGSTLTSLVAEAMCRAQARAVAVEERARLAEELEQRVQERTEALRRANRALLVLKECDEALARATDEHQLLDRVCSIIVTFGRAKMAWVGYASDDEKRSVCPMAFDGDQACEYLEETRITWADDPFGTGPTGTAIRTREICLSSSLEEDASMDPWKERQRHFGYGSSIAFPLLFSNRCLGALSIYSPEKDAFNADEIELFRQLAGDLAYGIVALRTQAERKELQRELLTIGEREKQVIAQELHDGLCQNLAGIVMMGHVLHRRLEARDDPDTGHAKQILGMLNTALTEARNISHGLHPIGSRPEGLMDALSQLATTTSTLFRVDCRLDCPEPVLLENETVSTHLFRITQEAVSNARKHGEADRIVITLCNVGAEIHLTIQDDGIGISENLPVKRGLGLNTMSHRANQIGAALTVQREGKTGTLVCCKIPRTVLEKTDR